MVLRAVNFGALTARAEVNLLGCVKASCGTAPLLDRNLDSNHAATVTILPGGGYERKCDPSYPDACIPVRRTSTARTSVRSATSGPRRPRRRRPPPRRQQRRGRLPGGGLLRCARRWHILLPLAAALAAAIAVVGANAVGNRSHAVAPKLDGFEDVNLSASAVSATARRTTRSSSRASRTCPRPHVLRRKHDRRVLDAGTLLGQRSTCNRTADSAAYWAPTLVVNDKPVAALDVSAYYRRTTIDRVKPFGQLHDDRGRLRGARPQSTNVVFWNCSLEAMNVSIGIPDCGNRSLRMRDLPGVLERDTAGQPRPQEPHGVRIVSASPTRTRWRCRAGAEHPLSVSGTGRVEVASAGQYSGHADFVNAWDQTALAHLVDFCLNALRPCGTKG